MSKTMYLMYSINQNTQKTVCSENARMPYRSKICNINFLIEKDPPLRKFSETSSDLVA